jgi:elongation factor G
MVSYLPSPGEVLHEGEPAADVTGPFAAQAFKGVNDAHGVLTLLRVYRGCVSVGEVVLNTNTGRRERIARIYEMHADKRAEREAAGAGDIVAVLGLKDTATGHTLSDPRHALVLEQIVVGEPVTAAGGTRRRRAIRESHQGWHDST